MSACSPERMQPTGKGTAASAPDGGTQRPQAHFDGAAKCAFRFLRRPADLRLLYFICTHGAQKGGAGAAAGSAGAEGKMRPPGKIEKFFGIFRRFNSMYSSVLVFRRAG